ncbi:hypothetical protein D3C77_604750 [compost metagenome]
MSISEFAQHNGVKITNIQQDMLELLMNNPDWLHKLNPKFHETVQVIDLYKNYKNYNKECVQNAS